MSTPPLNFQRAIFAGDATTDQCAYCGRGITGEYFRVGGHLACPVCAQQAQSLVPPDEHKVFLHALSFGVAAAILGCIGYATLRIATGWTIGYAAIGVGYMVGWAMRRAAKQHGGRRYQWAAALLTYAAVAVAFVPVALHAISTHRAEQSHVQQQGTSSPDSAAPAPKAAPARPAASLGRFFGSVLLLLGIGLISPFLELTGSVAGGLLNLFIIFIGVRFAWQMMAVKTVSVDGPFQTNA